jgi:hypothetical protein
VRQALVDLLSSKKAIVTLAGVLTTVLLHVAGRLHVALEPDDANALSLKVMGMVSAYVLGQGLADHGKEAARIAADTTLATTEKPKT